MASRTGAKTETRTPLNRVRVLRAAIAFADDAGIDALSMRRLGQELGVEAMSLYNHVASKDDLLDGSADLVLSEIETPSDGADWKSALRGHAVSAHDILRRHPWACSLALAPTRVIPVRVCHADWKLRQLREGGSRPS